MSSYNWQVYRHNGTSWVQINNVQSLTFNYGQRQLTDNWSPPVWTISGRVPADLGDVKLGDWISVINTGSQSFIYQVTNYEVFYGIDSKMDSWTMVVESAFSALSRSIVTLNLPDPGFGNDLLTILNDLCGKAGIDINQNIYGLIGGVVTDNENGLDVFTRIARTTGYWNLSGLELVPFWTAKADPASTATSKQKVLFERGSQASTPTFTFTDAGATGSQAVYDGLVFGGLNLNYANKVIVSYGSSEVIVGSGSNAFQLTTYSQASFTANKTANRYLGILSASQSVPVSISYTKEQQPAAATLPDQTAVLNTGTFAKITFRGEDYYATIIGQTLTASPNQTRVTLHLCASTNFNFFTLNSAILGILNQDRLGYL